MESVFPDTKDSARSLAGLWASGHGTPRHSQHGRLTGTEGEVVAMEASRDSLHVLYKYTV